MHSSGKLQRVPRVRLSWSSVILSGVRERDSEAEMHENRSRACSGGRGQLGASQRAPGAEEAHHGGRLKRSGETLADVGQCSERRSTAGPLHAGAGRAERCCPARPRPLAPGGPAKTHAAKGNQGQISNQTRLSRDHSRTLGKFKPTR